jgi:hypothetical protein
MKLPRMKSMKYDDLERLNTRTSLIPRLGGGFSASASRWLSVTDERLSRPVRTGSGYGLLELRAMTNWSGSSAEVPQSIHYLN